MKTPDTEIDAAARRVFSKLPHPTQTRICTNCALRQGTLAGTPDARHVDHEVTEPWWTPGQVCDDAARLSDVPFIPACRGGAAHWGGPHEIPPPDWRDPEVFLRLLMESKIGVKYNYRQNQWEAMYGNIPILADDPRAALILALDVLR